MLIGSLVNLVECATVNTTGLRSQLSPHASIVYNTTGAPRWSVFDAPTPGAVVNVVTEHDVLVTVSRIYKTPPFFEMMC